MGQFYAFNSEEEFKNKLSELLKNNTISIGYATEKNFNKLKKGETLTKGLFMGHYSINNDSTILLKSNGHIELIINGEIM